MSRGRPVRRWYEARFEDGSLWCGSSDAAEVLESADAVDSGEPLEFSVVVTYEYESREAWDGRLPDPGVHNG